MNMMLIVGLGNPGKDYERTRHNVGFAALDHYCRLQIADCRFRMNKKLQSEIIRRPHYTLAKPLTFMNNSGVAVRSIVSNVKCQMSNVIVVHDDIDLPFGTIRVSHNASSAGHNGVQSIIDALGTKNFWRIRIGIQPSKYRNVEMSTTSFVLKPFSREEKKLLPKILETTAAMVVEMIEKTPPTVKTVHLAA